jgi:hypothetical protein
VHNKLWVSFLRTRGILPTAEQEAPIASLGPGSKSCEKNKKDQGLRPQAVQSALSGASPEEVQAREVLGNGGVNVAERTEAAC